MEIDIMFLLVSLCGVFLIAIIILLLLILSKSSKNSAGNLAGLQKELQFLHKSVDQKLAETNNTLNRSLSDSLKSSHIIADTSNKNIEAITRKLTELGATNREIKEIGSRLEGLEHILKNPKQRGNLGEYFLAELLENVFHKEQFALQHSLSSGVVDAALFIGNKVIPLDAKFPHENYNRLIKSEDEASKKTYASQLKKDIKLRIDETAKYILPEENTTDFAFMLIPAEGLYYDICISNIGDISSREILEYGFSKKVIICSPSGFYAYLQTVIQGLKSLEIEEKAKEIQKYVLKLQKDLHSYEESFVKIGASLNNTVNHYNTSSKRLSIIDKDILKINPESQLEPLLAEEIDKVNL